VAVNDASRGEYGVLPSFLQAWKRPVRAASALSAGSSIGATTIAVTPNPSAGSTTGPAFKVGDTICIGSGANAEIATVASVTTTNINIYASATNETYSLVRAHNSGDPVYAVPAITGRATRSSCSATPATRSPATGPVCTPTRCAGIRTPSGCCSRGCAPLRSSTLITRR
jgi:hypothetical protein